ncbi:MAG: chorismate synthase, partial [Rhodothermia bacterium]|nr:chorismate synthase [Rhodothermia bacterium]
MIRILTAGESHGEALVGIVEGMPAGVPVSADLIDGQLARRWLGFGRGGRSKFEADKVHIYSGVRFGRTMGSPIALRIDNAAFTRDRSGWPEVMAVEGDGADVEKISLPRPWHADLVGFQKYVFDDIRPVIERSSGRETAMRVACSTLGRILLKELGVQIGSHVIRIGQVGYASPGDYQNTRDRLIRSGSEALSAEADQSDVRMIDPDLSRACVEHISSVKKDGDSLGGAYEIVVTGVPVGLGSYVHWDRR